MVVTVVSMRVLVAPQEFKGSLTAKDAARAISVGVQAVLPDAECDLLPMADGGPGTLEALVEATGGAYAEAEVRDPLMRPRRAYWGRLGASEGTAVVEMAQASGLVLLRADERDPRIATTFGTGELLRAALDAGCRSVIVAVGGSATNDGGAGMAQALGVRFTDDRGDELRPGAKPLAWLARIDVSGLDGRLAETDVVIAADVTNPLCGQQGASYVYGPQKGADESTVAELDAALAHYAAVVRGQLGIDAATASGAGAAGGLAYGLIVFCGARVRPGFEVVAEAVGLTERVAASRLVITGEGRLDHQSSFGKTTIGISRVAREQGRPVIAIAGSIAEGAAEEGFDGVFAMGDGASVAESMRDARALLERTSAYAMRDVLQRGLLR